MGPSFFTLPIQLRGAGPNASGTRTASGATCLPSHRPSCGPQPPRPGRGVAKKVAQLVSVAQPFLSMPPPGGGGLINNTPPCPRSQRAILVFCPPPDLLLDPSCIFLSIDIWKKKFFAGKFSLTPIFRIYGTLPLPYPRPPWIGSQPNPAPPPGLEKKEAWGGGPTPALPATPETTDGLSALRGTLHPGPWSMPHGLRVGLGLFPPPPKCGGFEG